MLNELLNEYSEFLVNSEGRSYEKTVSKYIKFIKESFKYLNINTLEDIDNLNYIDIRKNYLNVKRDIEGLGNQSLNLRLVANKSFCNFLKGKRLIKYNAYEDVKRYTIKQKEKIVDPRDIQDIIEEAKFDYENNPNYLTYRNYFILNLVWGTGTRNSETRSILIDDIDYTTGILVVKGKYSKNREIKLNKTLLDMYRKYLYYRNQISTNDNHLLVSKNGKPMASQNFKDIFTKYAERCGLEGITPHTFRHSFASIMINNGIPIEVVSKLLGHTNVNITYQWYLHLGNDDINVFEQNPYFKDNKKIKDNIIKKVK